MNNPAAVITKQGVIIVDPGSSMQIGKELLGKIRKVTKKPVIAVFNTHVHGDHWLGNYGISQAYPKVPIYAHDRTIERLSGGEDKLWLNRMMDMTKGAIAGTLPVIPTIGLKGGETLKLGDTTLRIHYAGRAHSDSDIMIEVVDDKALFFGDVVVSESVPNTGAPQDANFKGNQAAIESMLNGPSTLFIPGHGHSGGREVPESALRFLEALRGSVTKHFKQGLSSSDMKDPVIKDLQAYKDWRNFSELGRVITYVYQEVEQDEF
jgi:glyoxylase-like metal-dependent hydrolase (beta-lactamase superfamily II)